YSHQEVLLVERIGVAGMAILEGRGLEEAYRRQVAGVERVEEVVDVVLMVARLGHRRAGNEAAADRSHRAGTRVLSISRRREVLERLVVRDVVDRGERGRPRRGRIGLA